MIRWVQGLSTQCGLSTRLERRPGGGRRIRTDVAILDPHTDGVVALVEVDSNPQRAQSNWVKYYGTLFHTTDFPAHLISLRHGRDATRPAPGDDALHVALDCGVPGLFQVLSIGDSAPDADVTAKFLGLLSGGLPTWEPHHPEWLSVDEVLRQYRTALDASLYTIAVAHLDAHRRRLRAAARHPATTGGLEGFAVVATALATLLQQGGFPEPAFRVARETLSDLGRSDRDLALPGLSSALADDFRSVYFRSSRPY